MTTRQEIPTPALLLDLDLFEANLARMAEAVKSAGRKLRPHVKAHKCVEIAKRQMAAGACGLCVATVNEAEMLAGAGLRDLLLTSPIADTRKMARIVASGAMAVVDHAQQVDWYQQAAETANTPLALLVDLDVGDHRTGVPTIGGALELAVAIDRASHLWLRGVQAYSVSGSHGSGDSEKTFAFATEVREEMARHGLHTDIVSGGSTGTWNVDLALPGITELQAGTYPLMDLAYRRIGIDFENALTVLATVVSANHPDFVTVDAGFKAFSTDRAFGPELKNGAGCAYRWGGDEFGYVDHARAKIGSRLEFIPPHCDPTVNLYDRIYACRGERVEAVWPVKEGARGSVLCS